MATETLAEKLQRTKDQVTLEQTNSVSGMAGLYRHPKSGAELITLYDPIQGDAQSEAALRVGFEFVRPAEPEEIHVLTIASEDAASERAKTNDNSEFVKAITNALNGNQAEVDKLREENAKLKADAGVAQTDLSQANAVAEADFQTAQRGTDNAGNVAGDPNVGGVNQPARPLVAAPSEDNSGEGTDNSDEDQGGDGSGEGGSSDEGEKTLDKMNKTELLEVVENEKVEGVTEENTKKELVAAIQAKRDSESEEA